MTKSFFSLTLCAGLIVGASTPAQAFFEDLCFQDNVAANCLAAMPPGCGPDDPGNTDPACLSAATVAAGITTDSSRSMVHTDATYYLMLAAGFKADFAHFAAAYDQAIDLGIHVPTNSCGEPVGENWNTIPVGGFSRLSGQTGGTVYHLVPPSAQGSDGLTPDVHDHHGEATLSGMRDWAFGNAPACTGMLTWSPQPPYSGGNVCWGPVAPGGEPNLLINVPTIALLPAYPANVAMGVQTLSIDPDTGAAVPASRLAARLAVASGEMSDGRPVPFEAAAFGMYLHTLQDRVSHNECVDVSLISGPDSDNYEVTYSTLQCGAGIHAIRHYWETGFHPLAPSSAYALVATYDEALEFAQHIRDSNSPLVVSRWLDAVEPLSPSAIAQRKSQLIGDFDEQGMLSDHGLISDALTIGNAALRVRRLAASMEAIGFPAMVGTGSGDCRNR